jgi:L-fuconate dehydratase
MIDYLCFSGTTEGRVTEYVDHLHEHFVVPPAVKNGRYMPPSQPGFSAQMTSATLAAFSDPVGAAA